MERSGLVKTRPLVSALPIFPGRRQPSIFGASELNCRVRDGNGWTLTAISTDCVRLRAIYFNRFPGQNLCCLPPKCPHSRGSGTPSGTRTLDTLIKSQVLYQLSYRCISLVTRGRVELPFAA